MNGLVQDARDFNTLAEFLARRDVPQMSAAALQQAIGAPRAEMVLLFGGSLPEGCRLAGQLWQAGLARKVMTIGGVGHTTAAFLERFEDAERLSESEYVVDLYDLDPPISLDLAFGADGVFADGAAEMLFDEELDGWYIGERITEPERVIRALKSAGALGE